MPSLELRPAFITQLIPWGTVIVSSLIWVIQILDLLCWLLHKMGAFFTFIYTRCGVAVIFLLQR